MVSKQVDEQQQISKYYLAWKVYSEYAIQYTITNLINTTNELSNLHQ